PRATTTVRTPETTNWAARTQKMAKRRLLPFSAAAKATDAARARKIHPRPLTRKDQRFVRGLTGTLPGYCGTGISWRILRMIWPDAARPSCDARDRFSTTRCERTLTATALMSSG